MSQPEAGALPDPAEQPQGSASETPSPQPSPPPPKHTAFPDPWLKVIWAASGGNAYTAGGTKRKWAVSKRRLWKKSCEEARWKKLVPVAILQQETGRGRSVRDCWCCRVNSSHFLAELRHSGQSVRWAS